MESKIFNQDDNNPGHRKQKRPGLKRVKKTWFYSGTLLTGSPVGRQNLAVLLGLA